MAAVTHVAASSITKAPAGMGGDYNGEIIMLLVSSAGIIFIDHAKNGQPQPGNQYAALGIVGFVLLFLGQFWPELSFAFTVLIFVSIIFNAPNGLPFIGANSGTNAGTGAVETTNPSTGQTGGVVVNPNTGTATVPGLGNKAS